MRANPVPRVFRDILDRTVDEYQVAATEILLFKVHTEFLIQQPFNSPVLHEMLKMKPFFVQSRPRRSRPRSNHQCLVGFADIYLDVFGFETVSMLRSWRRSFIEAWTYIHEKHVVLPFPDRETSFRIVPHGQIYSLEQLKTIARAIVYLDIVPFYRRRDASLGPEAIQRARNKREMVELMRASRNLGNGPIAPDATNVHKEASLNVCDQKFSWSFVPTHSTVGPSFYRMEFCNPAPCRRADETLAWVEFAFSFVHAAIRNEVALERFSRGVGGLWAFMERVFMYWTNEPERMADLFKAARNRQGRARIALETGVKPKPRF